MSDQSPPPKPKPGSLRDRIAAFENKGAPGAPPGPPQPRPKPGGLQWKPRPPSPPTLPDHVQSSERKPPSTGGMSAADAMESIGRGGSLRDRMAALQGKGAFGGPPPPIAPKPNVERPKWKPPPAVPVPSSSEDEPKEDIPGVDASGREVSRSPLPRAVASPTPENHEASSRDGDAIAQEGNGEDPDSEEEERQRRAAIAARMARLGGAKFGMAPPIFAPKPVVRKSEPAPPLAPEVKEEGGNQQIVAKESNEAFVTSPPNDLPVVISPVPAAITETECKDEPESSPPVPTRLPASMPVPVGPRRAAPPRKKSKNAPTTALLEPPVEEAQIVADVDADRAVHDISLTTGDLQEIGEVAGTVEAPQDEHQINTTDAEQCPAPALAFTEAFHEPVKESEAKEVFVESAGSHVEEESLRTVTVPSDQLPDAGEAEEEEEEARRQRVAVKLAQMGAFNPLAGPPLVPPRQASFDEPAPASSEALVDVENKVNVDTEEYGEPIPSPPAVPPRHDTAQSIKHDVLELHVEADQEDTKVDEVDRVPAHRDAERAVASYAEEQDDKHLEHTLPRSESSEDQIVERDSIPVMAQQTQGASFTPGQEAFDVSAIAPIEPDTQEHRVQGDTYELLARSVTAEIENDKSKDGTETDEMPPPHITRPIPPPPVNFRSKPTPPLSPPLSLPSKTPLLALRVDEEECPPSPDVPPRPIPPPGRSGTMSEDALSSPPRRSMPPPPRRTSVRVTDPLMETPSSPPPVPTLPRLNRRPDTPPIITTLAVQDQVTPEEDEQVGHVAEEQASENVTPRPDGPEDEASARRRAIAERMARLGGIQFGAPSPMNPLSRPPLPVAPPPTSIPPDDLEEGEKVEEGPREEEEDEAARKQRIAAKLAGMGGMRLGMLPPTGLLPTSARRSVARQEDSENEDAVPPVPVPAPPQRPLPSRKLIEQELVQAGGESHRSSDDIVQVEAEESEIEEVRYSDAEAPLASEEENAPALPPPRRPTQTARSAEALPTPPPRMTSRSPPPVRPPIPTIPALLGRRPSATAGSVSASSSRQASLDESSPGETPTTSVRASESVLRPQFEYVMVEAEEPDEDESRTPPPPRRKSTRGGPTRVIPSLPPVPPPSAVDPPEALTSSAQWELPSIPQVVEFGERRSEDSTAVHVPPSLSSYPGSRSTSGKIGLLSSSTSVSISGSGSGIGSTSTSGSGAGSGRRSLDQQPQLTSDELMAIWGKTGVRVVESATALFEKSKRALVGDGSYAGFVRAVLAQVPGAVYPSVASPDDSEWGYVVYAQTGSAVQRRLSDILPGDIIVLWDARFKGHKGLQSYMQTVGGGHGGGGPLVGIVSEFDGKKSKVRVWQANQHVGQQTVEIVSYRLEDLKSGQVKVYRVLGAEIHTT